MFKRFFQGPQHELPEGCRGVAREESEEVIRGKVQQMRTVTRFACPGLPEKGEMSLNPSYDHPNASTAGVEKYHARASKTAIAAVCATCILGPGSLERAAAMELDNRIKLAVLENTRLQRIQALLDRGVSPEAINSANFPALETPSEEE